MFSEYLVHRMHMDTFSLKHCLHNLIAIDVLFVAFILKILGLDIAPELLNDFRARELIID